MTASTHIVAIAGGSGTRFWPLSRKHHPKQLLTLTGDQCLLTHTFTRVASLVANNHWWMVVGEAHASACAKAVPQVATHHVLSEPRPRNTAAAIGLAAIHIEQENTDGIMVILPADHHITDPNLFCKALTKAVSVATTGAIVTLGIAPTSPETGYGYIERGTTHQGAGDIYGVKRFHEKPDLITATSFIESGNFFWNAGIFVVGVKRYMTELQQQLPRHYVALKKLQQSIGTSHYKTALKQCYESDLTSISVDFGIMEKASNMAVVPVDCGWSDVGSFSALSAIKLADDNGNIASGKTIILESSNSVAWSHDEHVVALLGVKNLIVVHTENATLVIPKKRAQEVRELVAEIEKRDWKECL